MPPAAAGPLRVSCRCGAFSGKLCRDHKKL